VKIGMVAGEASGDLLGAGLIEAVRARVPDARFEGVAGQRMRDAGCEVLADADRLAVMGLVEPLSRLPELLGLRGRLLRHWRSAPPDVFVGVDAPDFNLRLEQHLSDAGIPTAHYVSPSVWAWRRRRVAKIRAATDIVLCILPFEKTFYDEHAVEATFVGHPTADRTPESVDVAGARARLGLPADSLVLAVLPGSRSGEVERLAPVFAEACRRLRSAHPELRFVTPVAAPHLRDAFESALRAEDMLEHFLLLDGESELAMSAADVVLLASGTAALEAALLQKPTVAAYRVAPVTAAIVRGLGLLQVDKFTLPNQMTEEPLIPELIQEEATPERVAQETGRLLDDDGRRAAIAARFAKLRSELALGASERAADAVLSLVRHGTGISHPV
jgi:lipid-A-disaccharide synthase